MSDDNESKAAAAAAADAGDPAADARRWLLESGFATLATLSVDARCRGYPFCSIVPFALDARGRPLVQIASIAAHTKNVQADARVSLFLHQPSTSGSSYDPQAGWRITVVGLLSPVEVAAREVAMARLVEKVPNARAYEDTHDFHLWRLDIEHVRYIGGFGRITWIDGNDVMRDPLGAGLADAAAGAVAHMNADHEASMKEMCAGRYGFSPARAQMIEIDRTGFLVRTSQPDRLVHFSFGSEIDAKGVRTAVVDVIKRIRAGKPR